MAVYTQVDSDLLEDFLANFDTGKLLSCKGIAEGVENSNYLVETSTDRFILTLYEQRVNPDDLPFFLALLDHLHARGCKVPRFIADKDGRQIHDLAGRPACLIEFLQGVSLSHPTPAQARSAGEALGEMHRALADFGGGRPNTLSLPGWRDLADQCTEEGLDDIAPGLADEIYHELEYLTKYWPDHLPRSVIHADLFPDNVLMLGDNVTGLIDFYFACSDIRAYDLAITHSAWCFDYHGAGYDEGISTGLLTGYAEMHGLSDEEMEAMPILARGACLRFLLTRAYDWINTPAGALVTPKDPLAYLRRLNFYRADGNRAFVAAR